MTTADADTFTVPQEVATFFAHLGIEIGDDMSDQFKEDANRVLEHAGVKGMKWGVRKDDSGGDSDGGSKDSSSGGVSGGSSNKSTGVPRAAGENPSIVVDDNGNISIAGGSSEDMDELWDDVTAILADDSLSSGEKREKIKALQTKTADKLATKYKTDVKKITPKEKPNGLTKFFDAATKNVNKSVDSAIKGVKSAVGNAVTTTTTDRKTEKISNKDKGETGVRRVTQETKTTKNLWGEVIDTKKKTIEHDDISVDAFIAHVMEFPEEFSDEDIQIVEDALEHHGVKGMKWGVRRRAVTSTGSSGPSKSSSRPVKRSVKSMTDQELNAVINRMRLESQYKQMTASKGDQARQFIKDTLISAGKSTVQTYANQYLNAAVGTALSKAKVPTANTITQNVQKAAQEAAEEARKAKKAATE